MPRITRTDVGDNCYHIINRANARLPIFFEEEDYILFEDVLEEAQEKFSMRILAYSLMSNHFHLVLYPLPLYPVILTPLSSALYPFPFLSA